MDLAELAAAAGLLLVPMLGLGLGRDRLAVGDLRLVGDDLQVEAALEPVLHHVQVQLAHAGDDHLVVCASRVTLKVGSSSAILCRLPEIFCSSPRAFGSTARPNIGVGNVGARQLRRRAAWSPTVSPMCRSSTLATATMSPAIGLGDAASASCPASASRPPVRADLPVRALTSGCSAV